MENSILNQWPVDPAFIIIGLVVLTLAALIIAVVCLIKMNGMYRRYDIFMRGKDAESLEHIMFEVLDDIRDLRAEDRANKDSMKRLAKSVRGSYQKFGMVKYNAFKGMGGKLSFTLALLDSNNTGFVLNSVHSREGCYLYMKGVEKGQTEVLLGSEEKEALEQALGYA